MALPDLEKIKSCAGRGPSLSFSVSRNTFCGCFPAIVSGVSETEVVELKKTEITDRIKESVEQNGSKPELFGDIVRAAILLLEYLIAKVMQKVMDFVAKGIGKTADAIKKMPEETENSIHANDKVVVRPEKKMPFPVDPKRKMDMQKKKNCHNRKLLPQSKNLLSHR